MVVLRIYNPLDEVLRISIDDKWRRWWLIVILKGNGVLGFELRYVKDGMDAYRRWETQREGHRRRLSYDRKQADFLLSEFSCCSVGTYVIRVHVNSVSNPEWRGSDPVLVRILTHGFLSVRHTIV